jgi:hypothetical protein
MGKVFNSMIMGTLISIGLAFFNSTGIQSTSLVSLLLNPTAWENNGFWNLFAIPISTLGVGAIVIGIAAIIKQDWVWRAGIIVSLSSIVISPFVDLFTFLNSQTAFITSTCFNSPICETLSSTGGFGQLIGLIIAGPLFLYAMWSCVEYIFKGDSF